MPVLTPLALQNASLLDLLSGMTGPGQSIGVIAQRLDRDRSNLRKSLQSLAAEGLVLLSSEGSDGTYASLTDAGHEAHAAIERANNPLAVLEANAAARDGDTEVPPSMVWPDPNQPRKDFDPASIEDLAETIAVSGWVQPILVRPYQPIAWASGETGYPLTAGERRWRAVSLLIERQDPRWPEGRGIPVQIRDTDPRQTALIALAENVQRRDLTPMEEANGFHRLHTEFGMKTDEIAEAFGRHQRTVQQRLQLLDLTDQQKADLNAGRITVEQARKLVQNRPAPIPLTPAQLMLLGEIAAHIFPKGQPQAWKPAVVDWTAQQDDLFEEVRQLGLVTFSSDWSTKLWSVQLTDAGVRALADRFPDFADRRDQILADLRRDGVGAKALGQWSGQGFFTPWLNPPYAMSPADAQAGEDRRREAKQAEAAREERERQEVAEEAAGLGVLFKVRSLEADAAVLPPAEYHTRYAEALAAVGLMGPLRVERQDAPGFQGEANLFDASGQPLAGSRHVREALRRLYAMGVNLALGLPACAAPATAEDLAELQDAAMAASADSAARAPLAQPGADSQ